jgi:hypothetical protein
MNMPIAASVSVFEEMPRPIGVTVDARLISTAGLVELSGFNEAVAIEREISETIGTEQTASAASNV